MLTIEEIKNKIFHGDSLSVLKTFPDKCIDCVVTSPPYWNLRDYQTDGQLGLEGTFIDYINKLCTMFDEVKRVLKDEGTIWVNIGDTYYGSTKIKPQDGLSIKEIDQEVNNEEIPKEYRHSKTHYMGNKIVLNKKCLSLVPERFAIEMINRGWILRNKIIWQKSIIMPRGLKDRFAIDFEDVYFFTKSDRYYFKQQYDKCITKKLSPNLSSLNTKYKDENVKVDSKTFGKYVQKYEDGDVEGRTKRCVWITNVANDKSFHLAPFPEELIAPMIKAGCPEDGIVLDIFMGTGTTAMVATKQGKNYVGIDIDIRAVEHSNNKVAVFKEQSTIFDLL